MSQVTDELSKIIETDEIYINIHPVFNVPKDETGWGFDIIGLNRKALSSTNDFFVPHLWSIPDYQGRYNLIRKTPFSSYGEAKKAGIDYYKSLKNTA